MSTIFQKSRKGRRGIKFEPVLKDERKWLSSEYTRDGDIGLPEISEPEAVRHYVALSTMNHHVDKDLYPLGSCTMKYNPKINEDIASLPGFAGLHPEQAGEDVQGALEVLYKLERRLSLLAGMDAFSLQGAAGAHGEFLGMMIARKYFADREETRNKVLVPDTAHGTNPASVHLAGFTAVKIASGQNGEIDPATLERELDSDTAVLMLTVPNTLGLFESRIKEITSMAHEKGALCYMDGANLNAIIGRARPGDMGFDIMHINLHKTFSTPHGGGGPGAGPVGVMKDLIHLLPGPAIEMREGRYEFSNIDSGSVGSIHSYYGNFAVCLRALAYIEMLGGEGLRRASAAANLNANYMAKSLAETYPIPYGSRCMHEFVASGKPFKKFGVKTLDIAKRLLDFGFHAPTIYFPLVVEEALMIEPTETESKENLDRFIAAMRAIAAEAEKNNKVLVDAPHTCRVRRVEEAHANRHPVVAEPLDRHLE